MTTRRIRLAASGEMTDFLLLIAIDQLTLEKLGFSPPPPPTASSAIGYHWIWQLCRREDGPCSLAPKFYCHPILAWKRPRARKGVRSNSRKFVSGQIHRRKQKGSHERFTGNSRFRITKSSPITDPTPWKAFVGFSCIWLADKSIRLNDPTLHGIRRNLLYLVRRQAHSPE